MKKKFRFRLFIGEEYQPLRVVSWLLWALLFLAMAGQMAFTRWVLPLPQANAEALYYPPTLESMRLSALGDTAMFARVMMLSLQGYDNQRGASVPFRNLNYDIIGEWLDRIVALDGRAEYPHFTAAKIYGVVNEESRRRKMAEWVWRHFSDRPNERWEWMAFSTNLTFYVLKDEETGLKMARDLRTLTIPHVAPLWPRQIEIWFLEARGDIPAAAAMLRKQIVDGDVSEEIDLRFSIDRLEEMLLEMVVRGDIGEDEMQRILGEVMHLHPDRGQG